MTDRQQQACTKAKEALLRTIPRWSDPAIRRKEWGAIGHINRQFLLYRMELIAMDDLEHPYPLTVVG